MQIIGFIVQGDRTSHGGQVVQCSARRSINGIAMARMGDTVWCPRCNRMTKIITSRFPQITDNGIPSAFDMDMTDCGASLYSRHNDHVGFGLQGGGNVPLATSRGTSNSWSKTSNAQEHFILKDNDTGKAIASTPYTISMADGRIIEGVTDDDGRTSVVWTATPDDMTIAVRLQPDQSDDPYHFPEPRSEEN